MSGIFSGAYRPFIYVLWSVFSSLLPIFKIMLFVFVVNCKNSLCILIVSPLSHTCFADIFSQLMPCLSFSRQCLLKAKRLKFWWCPFQSIFFLLWFMLFISSDVFSSPKVAKIFFDVFCFLVEPLSFLLYCLGVCDPLWVPFCVWCKVEVRFPLCRVHCLNTVVVKITLPHKITLASLWKISWLWKHGSISGLFWFLQFN